MGSSSGPVAHHGIGRSGGLSPRNHSGPPSDNSGQMGLGSSTSTSNGGHLAVGIGMPGVDPAVWQEFQMFKIFMAMRQLGPTLPAAFTGPPAPTSQMQPTQWLASNPMGDTADQGGDGGYDWSDQPTWAQVKAMLAPTQRDSGQDGADGVPSSVQQTLSIQQGTHQSDGFGPQQPANQVPVWPATDSLNYPARSSEPTTANAERRPS